VLIEVADGSQMEFAKRAVASVVGHVSDEDEDDAEEADAEDDAAADDLADDSTEPPIDGAFHAPADLAEKDDAPDA
jgi:hypothetical protein